MIILGIDPGTATTGWGVIEAFNGEKERKIKCLGYGCIKTPVDMVMPERLLLLKKGLKEIIRKYRPDYIILEKLFFGANSKTAMSVGQARGVIMLLTAEERISLVEYQGLQVKLLLTGYGRADKAKIQKVVRKMLSLKIKPKPDDAADALAVAICYTIKNGN